MQVTETKSESLKREFAVVVPAGDVDAQINGRLAELSKTVKLPGFRPGHVPSALLKQRYGDSVMGEVLEKTVNESSSEILRERDLRPAMQPKIEITKFEKGTDLEYTLAVELLPEIKPMDFSKIKLERLVAKTDEAEIKKTLERMAGAHKSSEPVAKARKIKLGDVAVIDFVGSVDGEEFPGGSAEGYHLELGSGSFIPGFEDQVIGMEPGEARDIKVAFPKEYGAEELAGKDALFKVKIQEVRETKPAPIDDELAKKMGMEDLDTLKKAIRENFDGEYDNVSNMRLKRALLDVLDDAHDFKIPEGLLEQEAHEIWHQFEHAREHDHLDPDMKDNSKTDDDWRAEFREIADRRVRLGLLLSEIGRLNKIEISQDDINKAIIAEAQRHPGQEQQVIEHFQKTPEAIQSLSAPIFEQKVVDFILELAELKDKTVSIEELMEEPDLPVAGGKAKPAKKEAAAKSPEKKEPVKKKAALKKKAAKK